MHTALRRITLLSAVLASALHAGETISLTPGPDERYRSPLYEVRSADGDPAFVYWRENGWKNLPDANGVTWPYDGMSADNHWISLAASGEVNLTIRVVGIEPERVELLPERPGNAATVATDGSVRVKLQLVAEHPGYYFVRINGEHGNRHPLFIFADPPEKDVPAKGRGVHFFGPGIHDIGPHYAVKGGETVYLAPGAVVQLGYGYPQAVRDIRVEKVEIIRDETETQNGHRGIIVLAASKGCSFSNIRFHDIKVYGDTLNLLAIDNLDQDTPWSAKIKDVTLRKIDLELRRVTVTGTERGRWWGPFQERQGQPMRSRLRTADPGRIRVLFDDVSIGGMRLESEKDFPNGLETQGDVRLEFRRP